MFRGLFWLWVCCGITGCAGFRPGPSAQGNPLFVRANNPEQAWEQTVDVLHGYYFDIERENKLDGLIETRYKTGAGLLELWHPDSVGVEERLQSTLQSIRRKAYVSVTPAQGGYLIGVEAFKEIEDVPAAAKFAGGATFQENTTLQRDLNVVVGQASPSGWIPQGRDPKLEQALLDSLRRAFGE